MNSFSAMEPVPVPYEEYGSKNGMASRSSDEVSASFVNLADVYVGPIKAVDKGNLRINIVIMDCGDDMLVYMLVQSEFPALKILEKTMYNSFSARLEAIYTWFCSQF